MLSSLKPDGIYEKSNHKWVILSMSLFLLYTIVTLMETDMFIRDIGIGDYIISNGKLFYSVFAGYYSWFLKIALSMVVLWSLISAVRVAIVGIMSVFNPADSSDDVKLSFKKKLYDALIHTSYATLGYFLVEDSLILTILFAPIIVMGVLASYCLIMYDVPSLKDLDRKGKNNQVLQCLNTSHHICMISITILILTLYIYVLSKYFLKYERVQASLKIV